MEKSRLGTSGDVLEILMLLEAAPGQSKGSMSRAGVGVNGVNCVNWAVSLAGDQTQLRGVRAGERLRHPDSGGWRPGRRPEIRALCVSDNSREILLGETWPGLGAAVLGLVGIFGTESSPLPSGRG